MKKLINELRFNIKHLTDIIKAKDNVINVLKMQNLDLYLKVEKYKRIKKLKL